MGLESIEGSARKVKRDSQSQSHGWMRARSVARATNHLRISPQVRNRAYTGKRSPCCWLCVSWCACPRRPPIGAKAIHDLYHLSSRSTSSQPAQHSADNKPRYLSQSVSQVWGVESVGSCRQSRIISIGSFRKVNKVEAKWSININKYIVKKKRFLQSRGP